MAVLRFRFESVGNRTTPFTKFIDGCYAKLILIRFAGVNTNMEGVTSEFMQGISAADPAPVPPVSEWVWPIVQGPDGKPVTWSQELKFNPDVSDPTSIMGTLLVAYYDESR